LGRVIGNPDAREESLERKKLSTMARERKYGIKGTGTKSEKMVTLFGKVRLAGKPPPMPTWGGRNVRRSEKRNNAQQSQGKWGDLAAKNVHFQPAKGGEGSHLNGGEMT